MNHIPIVPTVPSVTTVPTVATVATVPTVPAAPASQVSDAVSSSQGPSRRTRRRVPADEAGQTTAEYALLTGAIALLVAAVTAWATTTGKIGRLLDAVFNYLTKAIS